MSRLATGVLVLFGLGTSAANATPLCTVLSDAGTGKILKQEDDVRSGTRQPPPSKIALSLIGYDAGYSPMNTSRRLSFHEGHVANDRSWKSTVDPTSWCRTSSCGTRSS